MLGYLGMVVHARKGDPHDNQGDIILSLPLIEKPMNPPENFISNFRRRSAPVISQDLKEASFIELLARSTLRFYNSIRIQKEQVSGAN